jgi:hypothetical protein
MAQNIFKMETTQTAVEWLIDRLLDGSIRFEETQMGFLIAMKNGDEIEQAKAMEKEQIMKAYSDGVFEGTLTDEFYEDSKVSGEQYYNETFGGL